MTIATPPRTRPSRAHLGTLLSPPPPAVAQRDPPLHVLAVGSVHRDPMQPLIANASTAISTPRRSRTPPPTLSVGEVKIFAGAAKDAVVCVPPCDRQVLQSANGDGAWDLLRGVVGMSSADRVDEAAAGVAAVVQVT